MGFTKLDSGIVLSSVWSESLATRVVWVTVLAMKDFEGKVLCSRSGLMRSANVTQEQFDEAMSILEAPDTDSRSPEYEGRRIEKIAGGWKVLNHYKYRDYSYSNSPEAVKKRLQREKKGQNGTQRDMSPNGGDISGICNLVSSSSSEGDVGGEFEQFWEAYPEKMSKKETLAAFAELRETVPLEIIIRAFNGYIDFLKSKRVKEGFEQKAMYPANFLKSDRWKDFIDFEYKPRL